ncbi:MAG: hypothetical protein PHQ22_10685 [Sulfuricurvum sp.]|nr:hypothetical protein [Sulfuricurvum sp.]
MARKKWQLSDELPGKSLGWHKTDSQTRRRKAALSSRKGNALSTARALQALANVTQDRETIRKAHADAQYFYRLHNKKKKR